MMRHWIWIALLLGSISLGARSAEPVLKNNDFVAICGDSITEQKLYSAFIESYLLMCQPATGLRDMQFGWGGETAMGFEQRMENDVLSFKPTVATTCYGMNDGGYSPMTPEKGKMYRDAQTAIVRKFKEGGVRTIVLGSPGVVDSTTFRGDPAQATMYNEVLGNLSDIDKKIAEEEGVVFANLHDVMMDVMAKAKAKYGASYPVAGGDGVHPGPNGHLVMAYAFLKALGCDGNIGKISVDLASSKAEGTDGQKILSSKDGVIEIESTRYPFCFTGDPTSSDATSGIIQFFPFNQDLNRYQLVVKNAGAKRLKVSWGNASKEFSRDALKAGINLAAEFMDNPFSEPFQQTLQQIMQKQSLETTGIKQLLNSLPAWREIVPDEKESIDRIGRKLVKNLGKDAKAMGETVKPVKHTIKIEKVS